MEATSPEDFIRNPVSHPGKHLLLQEQRLERGLGSPRRVAGHGVAREPVRDYIGRQLAPPHRDIRAGIEAHGTKHARIAKHEASLGLPDDQVVMATWLMVPAFDQQLPGHTQMHPEARLLKNEEHLLAPRMDLPEFLPPQTARQRHGIGRAKNARLATAQDLGHAAPDSG
jgi:hypothetical protein